MMINKISSSSSSSPRSTRLGTFRAYYFGFFVCTAGFLFGYDTGIVGKFIVKKTKDYLRLEQGRF